MKPALPRTRLTPTEKRTFALVLALYFAGFAAIALAGWIDRSFGEPSLDQIIYHLRYAEAAAIDMGWVFVFTFIVEVLAFPLLIAIVAAMFHVAAVRRWQARPHRRWLTPMPGIAVMAGVGALLLQFSVFSWAAAHFAQDEFAQAYVDPAQVALAAPPRRNLILIYAESLEATYGDARLFGTDLLAPLKQLGAQSFPSYRQAPGTGWTIAGMVATQCGVPLRVYSQQDLRDRERRAFLPRATCLGDILAAQGYRNVFMGGAPLSFAGKGTFLRDHGYQERWGRYEFEKLGFAPQEANEWGLYDSALFERARRRLTELQAAGTPFNLTLLTLDTHNPFGFLSPSCRGEGAKDFEGVVACNARLIANFIKSAHASGDLKNTLVVVLSDHLAMPNPVWDKLTQPPERRLFNLFVADPPLTLPRQSADMLPFDMFPTILEGLGARVPGDRLALGYSGIGSADAARSPGSEHRIRVDQLPGSAAYARLWDPLP